MKKFFFFTVLIVASSSVFQAQEKNWDHHDKPLKKIEEWEKIKLIEILNMNEDLSVRFFARRNEHQKKMRELIDKRDQAVQQLEKEVKEGGKSSEKAYQEQVNNLISSEHKFLKERESYYKSLNDLLSAEQIAKLYIFEVKFRRELREKLMNGKANQ
jgi:arginine deiminase